MEKSTSGVRVFYSYSHKDEHYKDQLEEHLAIFRRKGLIKEWSDRKITGGQDWRQRIEEELQAADLILLLVSPSFVASDFCFERELSAAIARHELGAARVVPIFIRMGDYSDAPFARLQGFPKDAKPIALWDNEDVAWHDVAAGLNRVIAELIEDKGRPTSTNSMKPIQLALVENVETIDRIYNTEKYEIQGISTGLQELDRYTNGLKQGDLFVIAARPSLGKTNLALNIATSVALNDLPVVIFSTKMRAEDVSRRILAYIGRLNYAAAYTGYLSDEDWPKLTKAIQTLNDKTILIDDSPTLTISDLRERCLREKKNLGSIPLVLLDSVQYLNISEDEKRGAGNVGRSLKTLARELGTAIIVTSLVSREPELRPNKRPVLSDIYGARGLADEADVVLFVYRDEFYNPDSPDRGIAELIISKNHFGPNGTVWLVHQAQCGVFEPCMMSGIPKK